MKKSKENQITTKKTISSDLFDKESDLFKISRPHSKTLTFSSRTTNKQNIINLFGSDFVNINQDFTFKPNSAPFDDVCSMCSSRIYFKKFICVLCPNCVLCEKCEDEHLHPLIKCKQIQFSTINEIYNYLKNNNPEIKNEINTTNKKIGFFSNLFSEKYELKLNCNSLSFSMRPNKKFKIPITIQNLSKTSLDCEKHKLYLFARNNKDLKVHEKSITSKLNVQQQIDVNMIMESNDVQKTYYFSIELYTLDDIKLKSNTLSFTVEVNTDIEDEILNDEFKDYPKIIVMDKNIKKGVKEILKDKSISQDPVVVMQFLVNNKGDIKETIKNLKNMDDVISFHI